MRNDINSKQEDWEKASAVIADDQEDGLEKSVLSEAAHIVAILKTSRSKQLTAYRYRINFLNPHPWYVISKNLGPQSTLHHERALELGF